MALYLNAGMGLSEGFIPAFSPTQLITQRSEALIGSLNMPVLTINHQGCFGYHTRERPVSLPPLSGREEKYRQDGSEE